MGKILRPIGTPGQHGDISQVQVLIEGLPASFVPADPAYDADRLHDAILQAGGVPVIPPMPQYSHQPRYSRIPDKERNRVATS